MKSYLGVLLLVFLWSCSSKKTPTEIQGIAMTIPYRILIGDTLKEEEIRSIETLILSSFSEINQIYNDWNSDSEISKINKKGAFEKWELSPKLALFLKRVDAIVKLTEGRFDPTVQKEGPKECVGWHHLHFENNLIWKDHEKTKIDLGGVAKGFAVDLILDNLLAIGLQNVYVEWGGEIKAAGRHPSKRKWCIAILGLSNRINLENQAVATSGNYNQNWQNEDKVYTHIINPLTNEPLLVIDTSVNSVSVLSETCFEADAIATALMIFPTKEKASKWAKDRGIKIWIY